MQGIGDAQFGASRWQSSQPAKVETDALTFIQDVTQQQVAQDRDIFLQAQVGGPLIDDLEPFLIKAIDFERLLAGEGQVQPALNRSHMVRPSIQCRHGMQSCRQGCTRSSVVSLSVTSS